MTEGKKKKHVGAALPYSGLTKPEQALIEAAFHLNSAATAYELFKITVYIRFRESALMNKELTTIEQIQVSDRTAGFFDSLGLFNAYLTKKEFKLVKCAQDLNDRFAVGIPSYKTTEMLCAELKRDGWLKTRSAPIRSRKGADKVLYYIEEGVRSKLKPTFERKPVTSSP